MSALSVCFAIEINFSAEKSSLKKESFKFTIRGLFCAFSSTNSGLMRLSSEVMQAHQFQERRRPRIFPAAGGKRQQRRCDTQGTFPELTPNESIKHAECEARLGTG